MITRLLALASTATVAWLLIDESNYRRLRAWGRRFGGEAPFGFDRLRDEAEETADELRAVTLSAPDVARG